MSQVMQHCYCLSSEKFTITESLIAGKEETTIIFLQIQTFRRSIAASISKCKNYYFCQIFLRTQFAIFIIKLFILIKRLIILSVINQKGGFTELGKHKTATIMI